MLFGGRWHVNKSIMSYSIFLSSNLRLDPLKGQHTSPQTLESFCNHWSKPCLIKPYQGIRKSTQSFVQRIRPRCFCQPREPHFTFLKAMHPSWPQQIQNMSRTPPTWKGWNGTKPSQGRLLCRNPSFKIKLLLVLGRPIGSGMGCAWKPKICRCRRLKARIHCPSLSRDLWGTPGFGGSVLGVENLMLMVGWRQPWG